MARSNCAYNPTSNRCHRRSTGLLNLCDFTYFVRLERRYKYTDICMHYVQGNMDLIILFIFYETIIILVSFMPDSCKVVQFNPLPNNKILDWSKLKQIADDISICI